MTKNDKKEISLLQKSEFRYVLYQKRYSTMDDRIEFAHTDLNNNIIEYIESFPEFLIHGGWPMFAMKWDVNHDGKNWKVVKRGVSEEREWDSVLQYRTEIYPSLVGGAYDKILKKK